MSIDPQIAAMLGQTGLTLVLLAAQLVGWAKTASRFGRRLQSLERTRRMDRERRKRRRRRLQHRSDVAPSDEVKR